MRVSFDEYADHYRQVAHITRAGGILELVFHTDGGPLSATEIARVALADLLGDVASDPDNAVVILTGTGASFCVPAEPRESQSDRAGAFLRTMQHEWTILGRMLEIPVPVVAALNGTPAALAEVPLLADVVLAADDISFGIADNVAEGRILGGAGELVWSELLGLSRVTYFAMTGQQFDAREALRLGVVNELHPVETLLSRARELAGSLASKPELARRGTRALFAHRWRRIAGERLATSVGLRELARWDAADGAIPG